MDPKDSKLVQALIDNQKDGPLDSIFASRWEPCPAGYVCPQCKGALERTRGLLLTSPWVGSVRCVTCTYKDSTMGYLGRSLFQVEPLPEGAKPIFDKESP